MVWTGPNQWQGCFNSTNMIFLGGYNYFEIIITILACAYITYEFLKKNATIESIKTPFGLLTVGILNIALGVYIFCDYSGFNNTRNIKYFLIFGKFKDNFFNFSEWFLIVGYFFIYACILQFVMFIKQTEGLLGPR